jgi:hypothetical protein
MDPSQKTQFTGGAEDAREWELTDEDLDRTATDLVRGSDLRSTSRPCSCSRCHCR